MRQSARTLAAMAIVTLAATSVGCGDPGLSGAPLGRAATFRPAARSALEVFGHGLGWNPSGHPVPLVNDLPAAPPSVAFRVSDDPGPGPAPAGKMVDLRPLCSPVADQAQIGSCTGFAMVKGMEEFLELKAIRDRGGDPNTQFVPLSAGFLYYNERLYKGAVATDTGGDMFLGMNLLTMMGTCPEAEYPYPTPPQTKDPWFLRYFMSATPSDQVYRDAQAERGGNLRQVTKLSELKASLDEGYPVVFGFLCFDSLRMAGQTGVIPVPDLGNDALEGGHATCAVGYDDNRQVIILKNSWGTGWGDKGYLYMPYAFFNMDLGLVSDGWTMRPGGLNPRGAVPPSASAVNPAHLPLPMRKGA